MYAIHHNHCLAYLTETVALRSPQLTKRELANAL